MATPVLVAGTAACGKLGPPAGHGHVTRVIDGDTILVAGVGTVRYIGIDTPEIHHPRKPVERLARRASLLNRGIVQGRDVTLEFDREVRDTDGRVLAYVYVDGDMVNARIVRQGYARVLTIPPNTRHAVRFARLERSARQARRGLWGPAAGGPPWGSFGPP